MNTATISRITANHPVDRLGALRAQIATLEAEAKIITDDLKARGPGVTEGQLFKATVSQVDPSESYDVDALEAKLRSLGVNNRFFSKVTKVKAGCLRLTVKARR